jgi:UDP-2,3-diacylglucosamine pyrophosphatase LpxH
MENPIDTIIVSDIHLGSDVCRAEKLLQVLEGLSFRRLILLGDIFDDLNFNRLRGSHWEFLSYIRKISNTKRHIEIVWVEGNHDIALSDVFSHFIGIAVAREYRWQVGNIAFLAIHGHQFDKFLTTWPIVSDIAGWIYTRLQRFETGTRQFSRAIKRMSKSWMRISQAVAAGALRYAKEYDAKIIVCGHTHKSAEATDKKTGIRYYNTGCWTDSPSAAVVIFENGAVEVRQYP